MMRPPTNTPTTNELAVFWLEFERKALLFLVSAVFMPTSRAILSFQKLSSEEG